MARSDLIESSRVEERTRRFVVAFVVPKPELGALSRHIDSVRVTRDDLVSAEGPSRPRIAANQARIGGSGPARPFERERGGCESSRL